MKRFKVLRLSFSAVAFVLLLWSGWNYYRPGAPSSAPRTNVLTLPFEFVEGKEYGGDFSVDMDERYEVDVIFHRRIPESILDSLVGRIGSVISSDNKRVALPLALAILRDDTLLLKKDSVDTQSYSFTAEYVGRLIVHIRAERNRRYHASLVINRTILQLTQTNPELTVTVVPSVIKQQMLGSGMRRVMAEYWFKASGIFFLFILTINIVLEIRSRITPLRRKKSTG